VKYNDSEFTPAGRAAHILDDLHKAGKKMEPACRSIDGNLRLDDLEKIDRELGFLCERLAFHKAAVERLLKR
jgi:hypothetical protein